MSKATDTTPTLYRVRTPKNPDFSGKAFGVKFNGGVALLNEDTINSDLGWSVEKVAEEMVRQFGYEVTPMMGTKPVLNANGEPVKPNLPERRKPRRTRTIDEGDYVVGR